MNFTKYEQSVVEELEKRAGDVLYFKDIAPYFIKKSFLEFSTYTQTAYIQVGDNLQNALSEYFQLVVFLKKLEVNGDCFSIPYTPLEDNTIKIGNEEFSKYQQHTIADGDLLIQLFHYGGKKYVTLPHASDQNYIAPKQSGINFIIPSIILLLLFLFIGSIGYQSYLDFNNLKLKQEIIVADIEKQTLQIGLLSEQIQRQVDEQKEIKANIRKEFKRIYNSLEDQNQNLRNVRYWNKKQFTELQGLVFLLRSDTVN